MQFESYPFEKLSALLDPIEPNSAYAPLTLTIGEPQFETPAFIRNALCGSADTLRRYPKTAGEEMLNGAMRDFVARRFGVTLANDQLVSCFGTREVLFNFPQYLLFDKPDPVMTFTNPFYQIYEGAAIASRAKVNYLNLDAANGFKPQVDPAVLQSSDLVILNFPNNPTSSCLSLEELGEWVKLALEYDFVLLNDECYSEIYPNEAPAGILEASAAVGNTAFKNVLALNSISKRSSAPGLRSGFIAGDATILEGYRQYRTYIGCASPLPLQTAAAAAWADEAHVAEARAVYRENFEIAKAILGTAVPEATFYLWLEVDDAIAFTEKLYRDYNLKVLPGEYLARTDVNGNNPGRGRIRIALVESPERTRMALERIKEAMNG
ncbi:succinyldiaminopimelate transaminase [Sulfurimonas sp. HSL-3221]|uniref:succinyldiaminopimelate transaminase n=1 Tax=Sulfurimonadaceae TaxID=2771471 RepID=UPI001E36645C|nr:succinyldiaminopimelate transaminase [Sulfurimonas sp. HSL-3221]UFS63394.1 succinyldiaminopimelate transaminase [Sulfurimonas sp. HSL-3221]